MNEKRGWVPIEGSEVPVISGKNFKGKANPKEKVEISLYLRSKSSRAVLPSLEEMTVTPLHQRKILSHEELERFHGADSTDVEKVKAFAREHSLLVIDIKAAQRLVRLTGTVSDMSSAFNVKLSMYDYEGKTFRGHEGPVYIPKELEGIVTGVFGLSNHVVAHPRIYPPLFQQQCLTNSKEGKSGDGKFNLAPFFTPSQVAEAYNFPTDVTGKGQTIGLIQLGGGYLPETFDTYFGLVNLVEGREGDNKLKIPTIIDVECGGSNNPGKKWNADVEVCGDIEIVSCIANEAKLVVYFGYEGQHEAGFLQAVHTAVYDKVNSPSVISISWGSKEDLKMSKSFMDQMNSLFNIAASRGITVCVATGDTGSSDCPSPLMPLDDNYVHVDFPASSPWALACGGTRLITDGDSIIDEVVWNDGVILGATGGGFSNYFSSPPYQVPGCFSAEFNRGVPDVAGNASWQSGYFIMSNNSPFMFCGGTSAVAPLWGALTALLNQKLEKEKLLDKPLGFINPILYQIKEPGVFNNITEGNNINLMSVPGYSASPGWDACTGLGTPNGEKLYEVICKMLKKA